MHYFGKIIGTIYRKISTKHCSDENLRRSTAQDDYLSKFDHDLFKDNTIIIVQKQPLFKIDDTIT